MQTSASLVFARLEAAEHLAIEPTCEHMTAIVPLLGLVADAMNANGERIAAGAGGSALERETLLEIGKRIGRLSQLMEAALRIRLGLFRAATAGRAGYSSDGQSTGIGENLSPGVKATA